MLGNDLVYPPLGALAADECVAAHDQVRQRIMGQEDATRSAIDDRNNPRRLCDTFEHETLAAVEEAGLREATLPTQPWAGHYLTTLMASGLLGCRYQDMNVTNAPWEKAFAYIRNHPASVILAGGMASWIAELSPAEKYDALIGDASQTLTKRMWADGQQAFDQYGEVPAWFGICHGWAPAAFMLPRPQQAITLIAADGTPLTFSPADIKALATLLWANASPRVRFMGGRCNAKPPFESDPATGRAIRLFNPFIAAEIPPEEMPPLEDIPENERPGWVEVTLAEYVFDEETSEESLVGGRITATECHDANPGAWHLAVVNQLGVSQRSMVMDASFDNEVWNQPLYSYQYTYFNPQTLVQTDVLAEAAIPVTGFSDDIFKAYRSPQAASVVGIIMRVTYAIEPFDVNEPETAIPDWTTDEAEIERQRRGWQLAVQDYYYDLELDADGTVIGGEWYIRAHPDFLWTPPAGARAASRYEALATGAWDVSQPLPESWRVAARSAAADATPLAAIVDAMLAAANQPQG